MIIAKKNGSIYLKKNIRSLVWFQLYYLLFYGFFRDVIGMPRMIAYVVDGVNIILFLYVIFYRKPFKIKKGQYRIIFLWIIFFLIFTIIGLILTEGSAVLYVWGFRNVFRFYIFFLTCLILLEISDICEIIDIFKKVYIINLFVCTLELLMGYKGDYLGGVFGTQHGCNGHLNLLLIIVSAIYIIEYIEKKISLMKVGLFLLSTFYIMAIAELKVFLFEIPLIVFLALINSKFNIRKVILIMIGIIGILIGISMLGYFFEGSGLSFFTTGEIYNYMGDRGYTGSGDLSRFNAIPQIYKRFLRDSLVKKIFGMGLGNASYSSAFSFFNSSFYEKYNVIHYHWFTDSYIYIETGIIGLIFFEGFFLWIFIFSKKASKKIKVYFRNNKNSIGNKLRITVQVSGIVSILSIILSIYNSSLSMDSAYMAYFLLVVPVIIDLKFNKKYKIKLQNRNNVYLENIKVE